MKVVLFCGGLGTRLREHSDTIPKPLVPIGRRPIIWQLMKYYAHYGHKDFILCLGFQGEMLREYFLNYNPYITQDFSIEEGGVSYPKESDISDWRITFVDTGLHANIGERLAKVKPYLEGQDVFMANYSDQLSDLPLPEYIEFFESQDAIASFAAVHPSQSFHSVTYDNDGRVSELKSVHEADVRINGGFIILRQEIFDYMRDGEELVERPFSRLIAENRLYAYEYDGFWAAMDTFKDKIMFDRMDGRGHCPWVVWD